MASKNIKGITIEIGGNTTKLENALQGVDKKVYSLNSDLKTLNQALKLDPKNTELLAQKQDVLKRNIEESAKRLATLKEAQKQMGDYNKLTDEQKESYNRLSLEIAKSEKALKDMNNELKNTNKHDFSKVTNALKKVGEVALEVTKKMLQVTAALGGALVGLVTAGVKSYASLEQNLGGVETLFKNSADTVIKNAENAYKTAGMSANQYMETVTGFSASLLQSLGGDTNKAASYADRAIRDMSDNANKFGTDISMIQSAYQGFAKQNYNMLDNLKLGYGGNKTEMQRLIKDASKMTEEMKELGITVDANSMSFGNITNAISVVQKHLGVTGTTAKEANETISGSINSMKAAFDNFLNGSGSPEALAETLETVLSNVATAFSKLMPSIFKGVFSVIQKLIPTIMDLIWEMLPWFLKNLSEFIDSIYKSIQKDNKSLAQTVTMIINEIVTFVTTNLPKILEIGIQILVTLIKGITESLPTIIPQIIDCVLLICDTILDNLDLIIDAGIELVVALIEGLTDPDTLDKLMDKIPIIIVKIVAAIINALPKILEAGVRIITSLGQGILSVREKLKEWMNNIVAAIKDTIGNLAGKALQWGKDMMQGFINGIKGMLGKVGDAAKGVGNKIKDFLHFSRPDEGPLREYETWMPDFVKGLADGIRKSSYLVENASLDLANDIKRSLFADTSTALRSLNGGISTSLNPTINPSVAYDLNYQLMAQAMKEALSDVGVYLDERKLGNFIDKTVSEEVYS